MKPCAYKITAESWTGTPHGQPTLPFTISVREVTKYLDSMMDVGMTNADAVKQSGCTPNDINGL